MVVGVYEVFVIIMRNKQKGIFESESLRCENVPRLSKSASHRTTLDKTKISNFESSQFRWLHIPSESLIMYFPVDVLPSQRTSLRTSELTSQRTSFWRNSLWMHFPDIMYFPDIVYFPSTALPLLRTSQYALEPILSCRLHNSQHAHFPVVTHTLIWTRTLISLDTHTSLPSRTLQF